MRWYLTPCLFGCALAASAETVIPIMIQNGNPVAEVTIGVEKLRLIVDLGGMRSIGLNSTGASRLDIGSSSATVVSTNGLGESVEVATFVIPEIEIGGDRITSVPGYVWKMPDPILTWDPAIDGIIGREFLTSYTIVVDYRTGYITLYDSADEGSDGCGGAVVPLIPHLEGILVSKAIVDDGPISVLWDTGATYSFVKQDFANRLDLPIQGELYRSDSFVLGGIDLGPLEFLALPLVEPAGVDAYIGYNFFLNHVACFDTRNETVRIRAYE